MGNFTLFVDDNYHFMDEDERYKAGSFDSYAEAVVAAQAIVDEWLIHSYRPGMTGEELYKGYTISGEDPFIVEERVEEHLDENFVELVENPHNLQAKEVFSAWGYAQKRCEELCSGDLV